MGRTIFYFVSPTATLQLEGRTSATLYLNFSKEMLVPNAYLHIRNHNFLQSATFSIKVALQLYICIFAIAFFSAVRSVLLHNCISAISQSIEEVQTKKVWNVTKFLCNKVFKMFGINFVTHKLCYA